MKSLRRPVVYNGVTYPEYEMDFYTSDVYSGRFKDRIMKAARDKSERGGYLRVHLPNGQSSQHKILAETFPDLLSKSPLVSHYDLKIGRDRHEFKTPTGFTFLCSQVCPDHIDNNKRNNHHTNLMIVTQAENITKTGPRKGREYKGTYKTRHSKFRARLQWKNILDKNGKPFLTCKTFKTEEEAALVYNIILEESLLTIWGGNLGLKMYDLAYKNVIKAPIRQELTL
jgi:hypothetical protein